MLEVKIGMAFCVIQYFFSFLIRSNYILRTFMVVKNMYFKSQNKSLRVRQQLQQYYSLKYIPLPLFRNQRFVLNLMPQRNSIHQVKTKNIKLHEIKKRKKLHGFSYYKNMANFEAFLQGFKLSSNLLFLKSAADENSQFLRDNNIMRQYTLRMMTVKDCSKRIH